MSKHTPGPWLVHEEHRDGSDQYQWRITDCCESEVIASRTTWSDTANAKDRERIRANFNLIAAAPDLLDAATKALDQFKYMLEQMGPTLEREPYTGAGSEVSSRMDELRAAITRAGGGS